MDLGSAPCAWLTTLRPDGSPHTTSVWYVLIEQTFWIGTSTAAVKVANLLGDPRVSLAIDGSGAAPAVAECRARVHHEAARFTEPVRLFAAKYNGWDPLEESVYGPRVLLELPVDRWLGAV